jgi:hypothetical protein
MLDALARVDAAATALDAIGRQVTRERTYLSGGPRLAQMADLLARTRAAEIELAAAVTAYARHDGVLLSAIEEAIADQLGKPRQESLLDLLDRQETESEQRQPATTAAPEAAVKTEPGVIVGGAKVAVDDVGVPRSTWRDSKAESARAPDPEPANLPAIYDKFPVGARIRITNAINTHRRRYNPSALLRPGEKGTVMAPPHGGEWPDDAVQVEMDLGGKGAVDVEIIERLKETE